MHSTPANPGNDVTTPAMMLTDRYRIVRELGAGGMATVYLAEDIRHRRLVAAKVLRPELALTLAAERFLREIAIVAPLLHPHILGLLDSGESSGALFYVMPYVEGESLRGRLDRGPALALGDVVRILREVFDALAYAHAKGIVHRDIKPENVLLTAAVGRSGDLIHALVADFGIAKALEAARGTSSTLTTLGTALGTPAYMAPEQVAADPDVDHRADIYAAGVLAYELLAGAPPFEAPTARQVMAAHLTKEPEPLGRRRAALPPALEQLIMQCLEKNPEDRIQSAGEAVERLESVSRSGPVHVTSGETRRVLRERVLVLDEQVCRTLDRARLDPRIIGDAASYLDNGVESDHLVFFFHGTGLDQSQCERYLRELPYRAIAPTLFGFEPNRRHRIPLALHDHLAILRAIMRDVTARAHVRRCIVVGLSSGGDVALRLVTTPETSVAATPEVHGVLTLGCNLSLETCFATRLFSRLGAESPDRILDDLQQLGGGLRTLDDWINVHGYLVDTIRKLRGDLSAARQFGNDIVQPFADVAALPPTHSPFVAWYRSATERVAHVRCVFEDDPSCTRVLGALRLAHMDTGVLGRHHRPDAIAVEADATHFDLFRPEVVYRHIEALVTALAQPVGDQSGQ